MTLLGHDREGVGDTVSDNVGDDVGEGIGGLPLLASILMYSVQVSQDATMGCAYTYTHTLEKVYINMKYCC